MKIEEDRLQRREEVAGKPIQVLELLCLESYDGVKPDSTPFPK